jgi:hypothetical protein
MGWTVRKQSLLDGLAARRRDAQERPTWSSFERLGRAARWADQPEESREAFGRAALGIIERIEVPGRGTGDSRAHTAGFFALAGDLASAREWGVRAADELVRVPDDSGGLWYVDTLERNSWDAVATLYVCGERDRAIELSRENLVRDLSLQLLWAERDGDLVACDTAIDRVARSIVSNRVAPFEASGFVPIHEWDWLGLCFEVRARVAGDPVPRSEEMLERAGLLGAGPSRRVRRPKAAGIDRFPVTAADGTPIEVVVDRSHSESIDIRLDPREDPPYEFYLRLGFDWDGQAYAIRLYTEPESSPQDVLPYDGADFREAVEAAADWLDSPDVYGRDGTWAARTLQLVTKDLSISPGR